MMATRKNISSTIETFFASSAMAVLASFVLSPCHGQNLRKLQPEQYDLWSTLELLAISGNGNYISYNLSYPSGQDTLFVMHTELNRKWAFPKAGAGAFYGESLFVCQKEPSKLLLQDLTKENPVALNANWYERIEGTSNLVIFEKTSAGRSRLSIVDRIGTSQFKLEGITEYKISPDGKKLLYMREDEADSEAGIINLINIKKSILSKSVAGSYRSPFWQENSGSVCYILKYHNKDTTPAILYQQLNSAKPPHVLVSGTILSANSMVGMNVAISDDGKAVFFSVTDSLPLREDPVKVQVWNSSDTFIYPKRALAQKYRNPTIYAWFPIQGKVRQLPYDDVYLTLLSVSSRFAITIQTEENLSFTRYSKGNFFAIDLLNGDSITILQGFSLNPSLISLSPSGDKLLYFKDSNWWLYDFYNGSHRNLTGDINAEWDNTNESAPQEFVAFGIAGWSSDGKSVVLYERYDLWRVDLASAQNMRLTNGREVKTTYRLSRNQAGLKYSRSYSGHMTTLLNLNGRLLLESRNSNHCQEIVILNPRGSTIKIKSPDRLSDQALLSENGYIAYREQSFALSPRVRFFDPVSNISRTLVVTNTQQQEYEWGHANLIDYVSSTGKTLKGALFYPAGYAKGKKYPMVVEIYEQRSKYFNHYRNPSFDNPTGFNITNFTLDGYFVLLPDIDYVNGEPGNSARQCVLAAVEAAARTNAIDTNRVGLIGHSFGGYETGIILTGTDFFAAAVSGAGVSDPVGYIFTNGDDTLEPQFWRFESQQYRMGKSFYQDKNSYLQNSTIHNADGLNTPLLTWCGRADPTVTSLESIKLYNALRRLGRKNTLLIYPDESHYLSSLENKRDLTLRIQQWFGHFLKEMPAAEWLDER